MAEIQLLETLRGHDSMIRGLDMTEDGTCAVSASSDTTLKVWDLEEMAERFMLAGCTDSGRGVILGSGGDYVVSASSDKTLRVWDLDLGVEKRVLRGHFTRGVRVMLNAIGSLNLEKPTPRSWI